jgi:SnoaL-like domain
MSDPYREIARLIFLCDDRNDDGDFDGVGELFANGTVEVEGMADGAVKGATQVADQFRRATRVYQEGGARTHHMSSNLIIDIDEEAGTARCQSHYVMFQATEGLPLQPINTGRNMDEFERVDGVWQWKRRFIRALLFGDMTHHLQAHTTPFT